MEDIKPAQARKRSAAFKSYNPNFTNFKNSTIMEKISNVKKVYTIFSDEETRGFWASLRRLQKDCTDAEAAKKAQIAEAAIKVAEDAKREAAKKAADAKREAAKDAKKAAKAAEAAEEAKAAAEAVTNAKKAAAEAKRKAAEAAKRSGSNPKAAAALEALADVMQRKQFGSEDITKEFLLQYLPLRFNAAQMLCSVKLIKEEDAKQTREAYKDTPEMLIEREDRLFLYKPIALYTANSFVTLFCSAADARKKAAAEAKKSAAKTEEERSKREAARAARIEVWRSKVAAYDKEREAAEAAKKSAAKDAKKSA